MKIILHAGTPKTGTTALQLFLHTHRDALLDRGILYPRAGVAPPPEPKHQWMIGTLINGEVSRFTQTFDIALGEARADTHTVILSSEGLFHRWWDFSASGLDALQALSARFPLEVWAFFRDPVSFARSFYIQMLKNPRGLGPCYGEDWSISQMLDAPRFAVHLDYIGYIRAVESVLGRGTVRPFRYDGNTVAAVVSALGIDGLPSHDGRENRSVGQFGVELLRQINRRTLDAKQKWQAVGLIEELDHLVDGGALPLQLEPSVLQTIERLSADSVAQLQSIYGMNISSAQKYP